MKARWIIFRVLLLVLVASPSAMRAMPRSLGGPACRIARIHASYARPAHQIMRGALYTLPPHHRPTPRLHRIRGKKISIQSSLIVAEGCPGQCRYSFLIYPARMQEPDGPNPPRGPPTSYL